MLGIFGPPAPPIPAYSKAWLERRMLWLSQVFGLERLRQAEMVTPTPQHFPDPWSRSDADVHRLYQRVCRAMGLPADRVELVLFDDPDRIENLGEYFEGPPERIRVNRNELDDAESLVATLAHELSHALLLGDRRLTQAVADHELITDLLTVYLGMGIFASNSSLRDVRKELGSELHHQGYLSEPELAYALALFAWARGEEQPAWRQHLRPHPASIVDRSLLYLRKTGDTAFPAPPGAGAAPTLADIRAALLAPSASARIAALWDWQECAAAAQAIDAVLPLLKDRDPQVRQQAALALGRLGPAAGQAAPALLAFLDWESDLEASLAGIQALARLRGRPADALRVLVRLLEHAEHPELRAQAAQALASFKEQAAPAAPALAAALDDLAEVADDAVAALAAVGTGAAAVVPDLIELLGDRDAGMYWHHAVDILRQVGVDQPDQQAILLDTLRDRRKGPWARGAAAWALSFLQVPDREVLEALQQTTRSRDPWVQLSAACGLAILEGQIASALELLFRHQPPPLGSAAVELENHDSYQLTIDFLKRASPQALPLLLEWLARPDREVFAAWGLAHLDAKADAALAALRGLPSANRLTRVLAALAQWSIGRQVAAAGFLSVWQECLPPARPADAQFLWWIPEVLRTLNEAAVLPLLEASASLSEPLRTEAAILLAALAEACPAARQQLEQGLAAAALAVRQQARAILDRRADLARQHRLRHDSLPPAWPSGEAIEEQLEASVLLLMETLFYLEEEE